MAARAQQQAASTDTRRGGASARKPWARAALAAGVALGAGAAINLLAARRAEAKHPPIGRFIEVEGVRLHYIDHGAGPPVVLIHGSGALIQDMTVSGLVAELAKSHRVVAFDRPGYGYSTRPADRAWTEAEQARVMALAARSLGVERPMLIGHSWGVLPALAWALDHPGEVSALVLISGYFLPTPRIDVMLTKLAALPIVGQIYATSIAPLQTRITGPLGIKMIFAPAAVPERFEQAMPFELMLRPGQLHATAADSGQMMGSSARLAPRYAELIVPVTVIYGEGDLLIDQQQQSRGFVEQMPHAVAVPIPDAGHMLHHSHLDLAVAAIDRVAAIY